MSSLIQPLEPGQEGFLRDESRRRGMAESIAFPKSEAEVIAVIREADGELTIQGARTGVAASAVPQGGTLLNLSRMNRIGDVRERTVTVEPGALLSDIRERVGAQDLFFPPDPTEDSASIGGMAACNASGACSFFYGPTRNWITALRVVLADGSVLNLKRGGQKADAQMITEALRSYTMPNVKNAAGYFVRDDMDLIDLFIGAEGTLGVITELELKLLEKPASVVGFMVFQPSEKAALEFVRILRESDPKPVAIEYFNPDALDLLRTADFAEFPKMKPHFYAAVYLEFHNADPSEFVFETMTALGVGEDDCWFAEGEKELEPLKAFRHATPEAVNLLIDERRKENPELTKLGTDMSVPDSELEAVMELYNEGLKAAKLESVIFGHIGNNHLHVNILPRNMAEYEKGKQLYSFWADQVVAMGGSVSAEHGIGKIKVPLLKKMVGPEGVAAMRQIKKTFDPEERLNRGTLFEMENR